MVGKSLYRVIVSAVVSLLALPAISAAADATNPFFPLDNGVGRGKWTAEQQAQTVKEVGFDGIGYNYTTPEALGQWQQELQKRGMKLFSLYVYSYVDRPQGKQYPATLPQAIKQLKGTDTVIWLTLLTADKKKTGWDDACVKVVNEVADMAKESGVKVVLYGHTGFYVGTAEEALRIANLVNRPDVGITVNLCHELMQKNETRLCEVAKIAMPRLMLVTINGADNGGKPGGYIQTLDKGSYDVYAFLKTLKDLGYKGPIGLQCFSIKGDIRENLEKSMGAWKQYQTKLAAEAKP